MSGRADYIAGLRTLADILETHDELPLPYQLTAGTGFAFYALSSEKKKHAKTLLPSWMRAIGGTWRKEWHGDYFDLCGNVGPIPVRLSTFRDAVCKRVVTGTREVTLEEPDPGAPKVPVTRVIEDVEWVCSPILEGA